MPAKLARRGVHEATCGYFGTLSSPCPTPGRGTRCHDPYGWVRTAGGGFQTAGEVRTATALRGMRAPFDAVSDTRTWLAGRCDLRTRLPRSVAPPAACCIGAAATL